MQRFYKYLQSRLRVINQIYRANKFKGGTQEHMAYVTSRSKRIKENFLRAGFVIFVLLILDIVGFVLDARFSAFNDMVNNHKNFYVYSFILLFCLFVAMMIRGFSHLKYSTRLNDDDKVFRFYYMIFWILYYIFVSLNIRCFVSVGVVGLKEMLIFMLFIVFGFVVPIYDFYELIIVVPLIIWEFINMRLLFAACGLITPRSNLTNVTVITIVVAFLSALFNYTESMRSFYNEALMDQYGKREKRKSFKIFSEIYDEVYEINLSSKTQAPLINNNKYKSTPIDLSYDLWIELSAKNLIHPDDQNLFMTKLSYLNVVKLKKERIYFEARRLTEQDQYIWTSFLFLKASFEKDKDVYGFLLLQDIDSQKTTQAKLKSEAERDLLTNLYNKITTQNLIETYLSREGASGTHAMILMDIDSFKMINDTLGHARGDEILSLFAACMKQSFRESDILSRVGGDEFLVFMKNINSIALVCDKLNKFLSSFKSKGIEMDIDTRLSASIGISIFRKDGSTYEELFSKADMSLYKAKKTGKDQYKFASSYDEEELYE
ncbi:MAG: GGDEF domain-containing protein [Clostridia bacterium]|nr:GGDEF domain-containing protein [Clostridia bacterium]